MKGWLKRLFPWIFVLILCTDVLGKPIKLKWDASPTPTVTGYNLYWDTVPEVPFSHKIPVGYVLTYEVDLDTTRQYWFAVTAHDITGRESVYSNIVKNLPELNLDIRWEKIP